MIPGVIASMQPAAGGGLSLLVDDYFVGTNSALSAHTPDVDVVGGGWLGYEESAHSCAFAGFVYRGSGSNRNNGPIIDAGVADGEIILTLETVSSDVSYRGASFRNTSTTSAAASNLARANNTAFQLYEGATLRASLTGQSYDSAGAEHNMVVTFDGAAVTATLSGTELSYGSFATNLTTTTHGFLLRDAYGGFHDAAHRMQIWG